MPPPSPPRFAPGFRLSITDIVFILAGILTALLARKEIAIPAAVAVGHFFLFCNVFRIRRRPELIWTAAYLVLVTCTIAFGRPGWTCSTAVALALAGLLIARNTPTGLPRRRLEDLQSRPAGVVGETDPRTGPAHARARA